jgi:hypothetical protein
MNRYKEALGKRLSFLQIQRQSACNKPPGYKRARAASCQQRSRPESPSSSG